MKNTAILLILFLLLGGCSGDDQVQRNPYLPDLNFSFQLNLNLPQYNPLNYPGNSFVTYNYGINGIVIYNLNNEQYLAFELTDPNHIPTECSYLEVDQTRAACACEDGNTYTIITGQLLTGEGPYSLKPYRISRTGNVLEVWN